MNQKLENLLQLALQTPEEERQQTENLDVGYDAPDRTWELIVKYHGSLSELFSMGIKVEELIAGYAILTVPEQLVEEVAKLEQIEYVEMPKRFFYDEMNPTENSCIQDISRRDLFLSGKDVLIAVLDSGIDYRLWEFRNPDGTTRIRYLWDQTLKTDENRTDRIPPQGFQDGVEFDEEQINRALFTDSMQEQFAILPSVDVSGHGTAVAAIAAGSRGTSPRGYEGVAKGAKLIVVKLGNPMEGSFPRTTEIMRGVTWALRKAVELNAPLALNLSFGNSYGAHDGSSLLERFLDNAAEIGRTVICVGSGNDGASAGHTAGRLAKRERREVELAVGAFERTLSIQLWKNYSDVFRIWLRSPGGVERELTGNVEEGKYTIRLENTKILTFLGEPTPYSVAQEVYLELLPISGKYINDGVWKIILEAVEVVAGDYYFYLPSATNRNTTTFFYQASSEVTLTIPSTASKVITVGAYDSTYDAYADFSGRGYSQANRTIGVSAAGLTKPDLVAPGVGIVVPDIYGGYRVVSGTSFATPIVTGTVALLMEWGIVLGKDAFLYGEKVKAYLRKGALPIRGENIYPNEKVGWGKLCVERSLPGSE